MSGLTCVTARINGGDEHADDAAQPDVPWWSFTKTALAVCALRLVADGRLSLDDRIDGKPYSLRQLLQHRAGIPDYGRLTSYHEAVQRGDSPWDVETLLRRVGLDHLDFQPGHGWAYSNVGYLLVRRLIERVLDEDIETALLRLVFAPLGLASVRMAAKPRDLAGTAWGNPHTYHPAWVYHGLLIGTAGDAARFLHYLVSGQVLPSDMLAAMTDRYLIGGCLTEDRPWKSAGYGLGLMIGRTARAGYAIGHSGAGPGSVAAVYHFTELDPPCTVSVFAPADTEGESEFEAVRLACP